MARSTLSILGLYQANPEVLNGLFCPPQLDRMALIHNLLMELAEFEVLYPDPDFMMQAIATWSNKEGPIWAKLYATTELEYNPLENYDRMEDYDDTATTSNTMSSTSNGTSSGNGTTSNKVSAFNDTSLQPRDETTSNDSSSSNSETNGESSGQSNSKHVGRVHGNIGVTTSQQMLEEERRVLQFNIMDIIIDSFKRRFCLLVY